MAIDPRNPSQIQTSGPRITLEEIARQKIAEIVKRRTLQNINYQEPDDTCNCDDFVTQPPGAPVLPRRRQPPLPPSPGAAPLLPAALPPPPVRFEAPQLPTAVPPIIAPPPIIFPPPFIEDDGVSGGDTGATGTTEPPIQVTTVSPPSEDEPSDDFWGNLIACCGSPPATTESYPTDRQFSISVEESTHSGEFRNGCYPACGSAAREQEFMPDGSIRFFCQRTGLQICSCLARNVPSNPCYKGNGQISPPGANLTTLSDMKKIPLPGQYATPGQYYFDNIIPPPEA